MSRSISITLVCFCGLLVLTPSRADEPQFRPDPTFPRNENVPPADQPNLERRLENLEKQLAAVAKEIGALRKDIKAQSDNKEEVRIFALKHAAATDAVKILKEIFRGTKSPITLAADEQINSVVVRASADDLATIQAVLIQLDSTPERGKVGKGADFRVLRLKNASAAEMVKVLQSFYSGDAGKGLRLVADPATNSVLVSGSEEQMLEVQAIVIQLDEMGKEKPKEKK
jgi:type II secretory pathway component GspD/PulD (secretin)